MSVVGISRTKRIGRAIVEISAEYVLELIKEQMYVLPDTKEQVTFRGMPKDAECVQAWIDDRSGNICLSVTSEQLPKVKHGCLLPHLDVQVTTVRLE